jgi:hypothetical protein
MYNLLKILYIGILQGAAYARSILPPSFLADVLDNINQRQ